MENFEALQSIDNFCKVLVKKTTIDTPKASNRIEVEPLKSIFALSNIVQPEIEEPLVDVFDEEDHIRILVQCRCREQQVTFHPSTDGITICREERRKEKGGQETCSDVCRKLSLRTDELQLDNMEFVIAKCNNNNTLEAMIPKIKK
ncbi:MAG TPA: hypothetical protein VJL33_03315 [Candidatus Bathyarchaeia archaeon]|nr:hypothetical protein [Candidatus Bathyarchaeia archaeon]